MGPICPQGAETKYARIRGHISCFGRRTSVTPSVNGRLKPGEIVTFFPTRQPRLSAPGGLSLGLPLGLALGLLLHLTLGFFLSLALGFLLCLALGFFLSLALAFLLHLTLGFFLSLTLGFFLHFKLGFFLSLALRLFLHLTLGLSFDLTFGFTLSDLSLRLLSRYFPLLRGLPLGSFFTRLLFGSHNFLRVGYPALSIYNKSKKSSQLSEPVNIFERAQNCRFRRIKFQIFRFQKKFRMILQSEVFHDDRKVVFEQKFCRKMPTV